MENQLLELNEAVVNVGQVLVALSAGVEVCLAVPAEVRLASRALHVHATTVLLDPDAAFGALAPV